MNERFSDLVGGLLFLYRNNEMFFEIVGGKYAELILGKISVKRGKICRVRLLKIVKEKYRIKIGIMSDFVSRLRRNDL